MTTTLGPDTPRDTGEVFSGRLQALARPVQPLTERLTLADWLFRSPAASVLWLVARVWLGYEWANAGWQKIFGNERAGFWHGGTAVRGFALSGVAHSHGAQPAVAYGWWAGFLHNVVAPNSAWLAKVVAVSELAIGVALVLGVLTGIAAFGAVTLNVMYMLSGVAGVNPVYALVGTGLLLAWRTAGTIGVDGFLLPALGTPSHLGLLARRLTGRTLQLPPSP